ncbi:DUF2790 domain-containing protein [Pseudomonas gregormendelii]|uniref:DUF2790 domain-containing protein n=1 Tax=Pseudomonas gregormendelii TaxID=1628277 RepID=A0ABS3ANK9_9PSED|nr:DUF2790 domain-containing protein [Pseudomonas gregormendelii]MBN3968772.1 DUF2790 domain-containing protein [Pseudomonas gregormendelii]
MKKFLFLALSLTASLSAYAQEASVAPKATPYVYGMHLDIAKVINITEAADVCGPVPVQMTYNDSHGDTRVLEYSVIGRGCTN